MFARKNQARIKTTGAAALVMSLLAAGGQPSSGAILYNVFDLGTLGGTTSSAFSINDSGQVTGQSATSGGVNHAFRYTGTPGSGGAMADIHTAPAAAGSRGTGINASGQVVGGTNGFSQAGVFLYTGGAMIDLSAAFSVSTGTGINASGQVTAVVSGHGGYRSAPNAPIVAADFLGTLGGARSTSLAINDSGQVTGTSPTTPNTTLPPDHAFRTGPNAKINAATDDLGTLGGTFSSGTAINNAGRVAGSSSLTGSSPTHAFRTGPNAAINPVTDDLGTLGGASSSALGINEAGHVVGESNFTGGGSANHAFVYNGSGPMQDLNSLIPANSGWTLTDARDINNEGQIIGSGTIGGQTHAFLLTPHKPQTYAVVISAEGDPVFNFDADGEAFRDALLRFPGMDLNNTFRIRGSKADFESAMLQISLKVLPGDTVIVFNAGHGGFNATGDEPRVLPAQRVVDAGSPPINDGDEYLRLNSQTGDTLTDDELALELVTLPFGEDVRKVAIIASCFSGGFWGRSGNESDLGDLDTVPNMALFAASPEEDWALGTPITADSPKSRVEFALAVIRALNELADEQISFSFADLLRVLDPIYNQTQFNFTGDKPIVSGFDFSNGPIFVPSGDPVSMFSAFTSDFDINAQLVVPEPSSLGLLAAGAAIMLRRRNRFYAAGGDST